MLVLWHLNTPVRFMAIDAIGLAACRDGLSSTASLSVDSSALHSSRLVTWLELVGSASLSFRESTRSVAMTASCIAVLPAPPTRKNVPRILVVQTPKTTTYQMVACCGFHGCVVASATETKCVFNVWM